MGAWGRVGKRSMGESGGDLLHACMHSPIFNRNLHSPILHYREWRSNWRVGSLLHRRSSAGIEAIGGRVLDTYWSIIISISYSVF